MPLNPFDYHYESFAQRVLPVLVKFNRFNCHEDNGRRHGGGKGVFLRSGGGNGELLRYAVIAGSTVCWNGSNGNAGGEFASARDFTPFSEAEMNALRQRCRPWLMGVR